jgi:hypothetical protein
MPGTSGCCWPRDICTGACLARCCGGSMRCRFRAGSTPIAVAKSGAKGGGSEQCLRNRLRGSKRGSSDGQERAVGTPLVSLGPVLVASSLCRGQEELIMRESEVQIGNSGLKVSSTAPKSRTPKHDKRLKSVPCRTLSLAMLEQAP